MRYLNRKQIGRLTGRKHEWIRILLNGMRSSGRYPADEFIEDGRLLLVSEPALLDWIRVRKAFGSGEVVEPYRKERA